MGSDGPTLFNRFFRQRSLLAVSPDVVLVTQKPPQGVVSTRAPARASWSFLKMKD